MLRQSNSKKEIRENKKIDIEELNHFSIELKAASILLFHFQNKFIKLLSNNLIQYNENNQNETEHKDNQK